MRNMSVHSGNSTIDLDIIEELIIEDRERTCQNPSSFRLPGPPRPPLDPDLQPQNHRVMPRQTLSPSPPLLVSRGTASRPPCSFPQSQHPSSTARTMTSPLRGASHSGPARRGSGSSGSGSSRGPAGPSRQAHTGTELLEKILERPRLEVVEQPKERGMRFRYECEGRSAGSILGASSSEASKTLPAIEIQGPIQHIKKVTVTVSLVTKDIPHRPHPHCLVGKDCAEGAGICVVSFNPNTNRRHSFANLGIQCIRRKELDTSLAKRRNLKIDPFNTGHSKSIEDMDMNVVRLCFQCELEWDDGKRDSLNPLVSNPIYDKKATTTSELKINRLNTVKGPCTGKTEIYMLCDKVQKDDIEIIFKRGSWEAKAEFAQTDVHRQIAIVFKSPSYQEQDVVEDVVVNVFLRRISDHMDSEPVTFTYEPDNSDPYEVKRKRKIKTDIKFTERSCVAAQSLAVAEPSTSQPFQPLPLPSLFPFASAENRPEEVQPLSQPGASTMEEIHYSEPQGANLPTSDLNGEDWSQLCQVLERMENVFQTDPIYQAMLYDSSLTSSLLPGFGQMTNSNSNVVSDNMDLNFNLNLSGVGQDLGYYNDMQFSQLVNENQAPLTGPLPQGLPDSSPQDLVQCDNEGSLLLQVKTERDL